MRSIQSLGCVGCTPTHPIGRVHIGPRGRTALYGAQLGLSSTATGAIIMAGFAGAALMLFGLMRKSKRRRR